MFTTLYINFSDAQGQITLGVGGGIWPKFEHIQAFMDFSRRSRAANSAVLGPIWPNFKLVRDIIDVLVTCKYKEDPIKNEGARESTTLTPL